MPISNHDSYTCWISTNAYMLIVTSSFYFICFYRLIFFWYVQMIIDSLIYLHRRRHNMYFTIHILYVFFRMCVIIQLQLVCSQRSFKTNLNFILHIKYKTLWSKIVHSVMAVCLTWFCVFSCVTFVSMST